MDEIIDLVDLVSKKRTNKLEILGDPKNKTSKVQEFYNGINEGKIKTDADALDLLYGLSVTNQKYTKLKNRLEDKLVNTLFFLDLEDQNTSELRKYYSIGCKLWAATRLLLARNKGNIAIKLSKKGLKIAERYEFTDLGLLFSKHLRVYFGTNNFNKKQLEKYNELFFKYYSQFESESIAEGLYGEIIALNKRQNKISAELRKTIEEYTKILFEEKTKNDTYRTSMFYYVTAASQFENKSEYISLAKLIEESLEYFNKKPFDTSAVRVLFLKRLQTAYLKMNKREEVESIFVERLDTFINSDVYLSVLIEQIHYFFLEKKYKEAKEAFLKGFKQLKALPIRQDFKQEWAINEAYFNFLLLLNKITPTEEELELIPKFRLYKFLNNIPLYSKEKSGRNIPILIIHVLFLLQMRKYNQIIDRTEALNQYAYRYLRKDDTFRSNAFIKMLLCAPKADFNRIRTARYAQKYIDKLHSMPWEKSTSPLEVEIIPYEDLWEFVLELLD